LDLNASVFLRCLAMHISLKQQGLLALASFAALGLAPQMAPAQTGRSGQISASQGMSGQASACAAGMSRPSGARTTGTGLLSTSLANPYATSISQANPYAALSASGAAGSYTSESDL